MSSSFRCLPPAVLFAILVLMPIGALTSLVAEIIPSKMSGGNLRHLTSPDYEVRYRAAWWAIEAKDEGFDERLAALAGEKRVRNSSVAQAAVDFVRWKRSGEPMPPASANRSKRPNVILISVDALRPDHLGCYGYSRPTTPNIDALAGRGVLFESAYSPAPWTLPGHMSMFTSLYPSFHKLDHGNKYGTVRLDSSERTLTELLKGSGYRTASFVSHPFLAAQWGFDRGFDLYVRQVGPAEQQTDRVLTWLEWHLYHQRRGLEPSGFFLFVHFIDPHETYSAPPPFLDRFTGSYAGSLKPTDHLVTMFSKKPFPSVEDYRYAVALYDGEIAYVDHQLGRLWSGLEKAGWLESSLIALTSDHGEEFKDHHSMGHKESLYDEQLQVPLIVAYPGRLPAGRRLSEAVSLIDIQPTLLGLLGEIAPTTIQGLDLEPLLTGVGTPDATLDELRERLASRPLFGELGPLGFRWERSYYKRSIRSGRYKLILNYPSRGVVTRELYDLQSDPREQRNLYPRMSDRPEIRQLEQRLADFIREGTSYNENFRQRNKIQINEAIQERLRSLGYLD